MKIDFTINGFSDALILPDDHGFSDAEIEAMKQTRYDNWQIFINTPVEFVPSEEDVQALEE